jgi:hypothetical protein
MTKNKLYEGWVSVFETWTDYEADIVRDRLDSSDIPAVVLTLRDHAFNLTTGGLATVLVMVPPDQVDAAQQLLNDVPFTDEELEQAASDADPSTPDAHEPGIDSLLDSGLDTLRFPSEESGDEDRLA